MSTLSWIIVFCLIGGALSVIAASVFLFIPNHMRQRLLPHMLSFAIGALLGAAFLALLPHALEGPGVVDLHAITLTVLLGVLGFFLLEKMVLWRHCHTDECEAHVDVREDQPNRAAGAIVLIGDSLHNFVDGILIAAAFLTDIHLGVVTALAVAAHEIPQEVGDFIILLHSGYSRARALFFNLLSSLTTVIGGILAWYGLSGLENILPYVLALAASSFIYIAIADLIPTLHKRAELRETLQQILLIVAGVSIIYMAHSTLH
jgi:zinc and cadmium transporter